LAIDTAPKGPLGHNRKEKEAMSIKIVKTGWATITGTMCGLYVPLEGSTPEDAEPLLFDTREEAETERLQYIDDCLEAYSRNAAVAPEELPEYMERQRESLENEEHVLFVGVDTAGDVFELDHQTLVVRGRILRPDRQ
jgi:hypothetical protein